MLTDLMRPVLRWRSRPRGGLSGVLQTIADIVSGGFDMEPVIRPVLDLSAVSAGADALNNLFYSQRAVGLVGQAAVAFEAQRGGSSQTTISVDNDDVVAELRTLRGEMASMLERMEKLRVVLNTGVLVGELAEPMDVALGQRSTQRGRGDLSCTIRSHLAIRTHGTIGGLSPLPVRCSIHLRKR